jgi:hypothetical protein
MAMLHDMLAQEHMSVAPTFNILMLSTPSMLHCRLCTNTA